MQHILTRGTWEVLINTQRSSYIANFRAWSMRLNTIFYPAARIHKDYKTHTFALFFQRQKKKKKNISSYFNCDNLILIPEVPSKQQTSPCVILNAGTICLVPAARYRPAMGLGFICSSAWDSISPLFSTANVNSKSAAICLGFCSGWATGPTGHILPMQGCTAACDRGQCPAMLCIYKVLWKLHFFPQTSSPSPWYHSGRVVTILKGVGQTQTLTECWIERIWQQRCLGYMKGND